jgi:hypothetical protein
METIKDRIKMLVDREGSLSNFAKKTQIEKSVILGIIKNNRRGGTNFPSFKVLENICKVYPNDIKWLILGIKE